MNWLLQRASQSGDGGCDQMKSRVSNLFQRENLGYELVESPEPSRPNTSSRSESARVLFTFRRSTRATFTFILLPLITLLLLSTAVVHPSSPLHAVYHSFTRTSTVERNPNVTFSEYLHQHFSPEKDVVMWTFADAKYLNAIRNWDARREEFGMSDTVMTICLDTECLDSMERLRMRAYGGWLREFVEIPGSSDEGEQELQKRQGDERGIYMGYLKFRGMLEINQAGFHSLFFEGDTFFTADPFNYMRPLSMEDWDMQFTEDLGHPLNFGWIFQRSSESTIKFWEKGLNEFLKERGWDQEVLGNTLRALGGREDHRKDGLVGDEHWWTIDPLNLRIFMLPLRHFLAYHTVGLEWYKPNDTTLESVIMHHLTAVNMPNRQFYPKEKGWFTNLDGYYTTPRAIVTSSSLNGTEKEIVAASRLLNIIANVIGKAFMIPSEVTIIRNGTAYRRPYTRVMNIDAAITNKVDLLESDFFSHASRYLPRYVSSTWTLSSPIIFDTSNLSSAQELIELLSDRPNDPFEVLELRGFQDAGVQDWDLEDIEVDESFKKIPLCIGYEKEFIPFPWCVSE